MHPNQIQEKLKHSIQCALDRISTKLPPKEPLALGDIKLETPKDHKHGDLTTNVAMRLAGKFSQSGVALANLIKEELANVREEGPLCGIISKVEVSAPGFINFWLSGEYLYEILSLICRRREAFGNRALGKGKKVNIEFVSANPTGPLTVAHGRQAAVGDALGRILEFSGYGVSREFFINDVGVQIELLGKSVYARYLGLFGMDFEFPEGGYHGEYIKEIAKDISDKYGRKFTEGNVKDLRFISRYAAGYILNTIKEDLKKFGVSFDKWFSQKTLSPARIKSVLNKLKSKGYIYEKDGAVWFKSTAFGDDKDRVVIKSDGAFTYLAPDIAYHLDKHKRGFSKLINIWGPDHHGYVPRLEAAIEALGYKKESISILIVQLATLYRDGVALSMSTRKGEFITLREVIDEVGCDVAKYFFLMRKLDSHLDFDLEVAKKNSLDNPVYYIQYAHARIASILGFSEGLKNQLNRTEYTAGILSEPEELLLLRMLCRFSPVVESGAESLEPYRIIEFLNDLAKVFHNFYTKHRVVSESELSRTKARLELVNGVKIILAKGLGLLGISFPERM